MPGNHNQTIIRLQACIAVLWPSFVVAILASGLFFSAFNPEDLFPFDSDEQFSLLGVYTVGFFLFWAFAALSGLGTLYFTMTNSYKQHHNPGQTS